MKRLIIYDLDGTLVDTGEDIAEAVNAMLKELTGAALPRDAIRRCVGQGLHDLVRRCLKTDDEALVERGTVLFGDYYGRHLLDHSRLYPQARQTLDYFRDRTQAIVTNKPQPFARDLLAGLGVADYFLEIIAPGSGFPKKPDPAAVHHLMARQRLAAEEVLLVGDSLIDVETGRNAGVLTVALTHGFQDQEDLAAADPDLLVHNFEELLALARRQTW